MYQYFQVMNPIYVAWFRQYDSGTNILENIFPHYIFKEALIKSKKLDMPSFWRRPESSQNNCLLDAGIHQYDDENT